jgi:xanthine dehydrogenase YagS FAD-binding subunit
MKNFEYAAPRTTAEALALLSPDLGVTEILAGGTDLVGLMKKMIITPDRVVNIMEIPSLKQLERQADGSLVIGATVTLDELVDHPYLDDYPGLRLAIRGINSMQYQCQGTIGGEILQRPQCWFFRDGEGLLAAAGKLVEEGDNRFHAIFGNAGAAKFVNSSRTAPALIALNAHVKIQGPEAQHEELVPLADFYRVPRHERQRETILAPNQLLTQIVLPPSSGISSASYEVRHGEGADYPLAAAAAALQMESGIVREARIVLGQVAPTPWPASAAAALLIGRRLDNNVADEVGDAAVAHATPLSQNSYKLQLAKVAVKRALLMAAGLPTGGF